MPLQAKISNAAGKVITTLTTEQQRRNHAHTILVTVAFILFWVPVVIAAKIAGEVIERQPIRADIVIMDFIHSFSTPALDNFFLLMTALGQPLTVTGASIIVLAVCAYKRWYRAAFALVAGVGGALVANLTLKGIFARARPSVFDPLIVEKSYSFPSGHAMVSSALVCTVMLILWHTKFRWLAVVLGFLATGLIGLSRIYLGVHYPTDIIAGWSIGLVWAVITGSLVLNRPFAIGQHLAHRIHHAK